MRLCLLLFLLFFQGFALDHKMEVAYSSDTYIGLENSVNNSDQHLEFVLCPEFSLLNANFEDTRTTKKIRLQSHFIWKDNLAFITTDPVSVYNSSSGTANTKLLEVFFEAHSFP